MKQKKPAKKRSSYKSKVKKHLKSDIKYYNDEANQDRDIIKSLKGTSNRSSKKKIVKHLKDDTKGFKDEIKEDRELITALKKERAHKKRSKKKKK